MNQYFIFKRHTLNKRNPLEYGDSVKTLSISDNIALAADLYELTMAAAYYDNKDTSQATFELFVRTFPKNRSYLIAAGLEQVVDYLLRLRF